MEIRKRIRKYKVWILLGVIAFVIVACYVAINAQLQPALIKIAQVRVNAMASDAMYGAVLEYMNSLEQEEPYFDVRASGDQVYYVELNRRALTKFGSECSLLAQKRLLEYGMQGISVPIGTASGISIFAGMGPNIQVTFRPENNMQTHFSSEFRSAGINQTLHRVIMKLEAQIAIILPGHTEIIYSYTDIPVAEQIIVGKVPQTYADLNLNGSGDAPLNLVPQQ